MICKFRNSARKFFSLNLRFPAKIFFAFVLLLSLAAFQVFSSHPADATTEQTEKKIYIIGHRGAAGLAPENTIVSFSKAFEIGVDAIELDVHLSADNVLIVYHDFTLKPEVTRTSDGEWLDVWKGLPIKELTLAELKTYDIGRLKPYTSYASRYPLQKPVDGARIPTLIEVIELFKSRSDQKAQLWIEIKTSPEKRKVSQSPEAVAEAIVKVLREQYLEKQVKILSFDWRALVHVQKIAPDISTVYVSHTGVRLNNIKPGQPGSSLWLAGIDVDDYGGSIPRAVKASGGRYWAPNYKTITDRSLQEANSLSIKVFVWTPDSPHDMIRLIKMGVDGIITNRPDILKSLLEKK